MPQEAGDGSDPAGFVSFRTMLATASRTLSAERQTSIGIENL